MKGSMLKTEKMYLENETVNTKVCRSLNSARKRITQLNTHSNKYPVFCVVLCMNFVFFYKHILIYQIIVKLENT